MHLKRSPYKTPHDSERSQNLSLEHHASPDLRFILSPNKTRHLYHCQDTKITQRLISSPTTTLALLATFRVEHRALIFSPIRSSKTKALRNMAPVIWGLDLKEIHPNKFKSSNMWSNVSVKGWSQRDGMV